MASHFATPVDFMHAGIRMGFGRERRDFESMAGSSFEVMALAWNLLDLGYQPGARFKHLLWGAMLLKTRGKEAALCALAGVCRATFRKWAWIMFRRVSGLRPHVVSLIDFDYEQHCV